MEITFTKTGERTYEVGVRRDVRVCRALREAESAWAALPVGEGVKVTWASAQRKGAARRKRA